MASAATPWRSFRRCRALADRNIEITRVFLPNGGASSSAPPPKKSSARAVQSSTVPVELTSDTEAQRRSSRWPIDARRRRDPAAVELYRELQNRCYPSSPGSDHPRWRRLAVSKLDRGRATCAALLQFDRYLAATGLELRRTRWQDEASAFEALGVRATSGGRGKLCFQRTRRRCLARTLKLDSPRSADSFSHGQRGVQWKRACDERGQMRPHARSGEFSRPLHRLQPAITRRRGRHRWR